MQKQPDIAFFLCPPAFGGTLPAKIPNAHSLAPEPANMLRIECALGPPVEDCIRVQKDPDRRQVVVEPAPLSGRYFRAAEAFPRPVGTGQYDAHLLDIGIVVDDHD